MAKSSTNILVTGGSGYFGETLCRRLLIAGHSVRVLDLNQPSFSHDRLEFVRGDIRDPDVVASACHEMALVHHNVAQVPLAKERHLFWSVNYQGTKILLTAARKAGIKKMVYTSSSAVFGVPASNPVTEATMPSPAEDYGRAKLAGEDLCKKATAEGFDVSIIRPRTILGPGRLGIVQILFDWLSRGRDVPVFDDGRNVYQFIHADDLAVACIAAGERPGSSIYNIGAQKYGTMAETLTALIRHAGTGSRLRSVPMRPVQVLMRAAEVLGLSPLGPYHALMFGRSLFFDTAKAERELNWRAQYSNTQMIFESYDWYFAHRAQLLGTTGQEGRRSHHQAPVKQGLLAAIPSFLTMCPEVKI